MIEGKKYRLTDGGMCMYIRQWGDYHMIYSYSDLDLIQVDTLEIAEPIED